MIRRRVVVHGRVQGVLFRDSTREAARSRGVGGWVRNRDDGTVEAAFEGEPEAVEQMLEFCRQGSEDAQVERVAEHGEEPTGEAGFRVL